MSQSCEASIWEHVNAIRNGRVFYGSCSQIAQATGISESSVKQIMGEWRDVGAVETVRAGCRRIVSKPNLTRKPCPDRWSDERKDRLSALSAQGLTIDAMAERLYVSRNAVTGQRARMGLEKRPSPIKRGGVAR